MATTAARRHRTAIRGERFEDPLRRGGYSNFSCYKHSPIFRAHHIQDCFTNNVKPFQKQQHGYSILLGSLTQVSACDGVQELSLHTPRYW